MLVGDQDCVILGHTNMENQNEAMKGLTQPSLKQDHPYTFE